jgi:hypothetical protein
MITAVSISNFLMYRTAEDLLETLGVGKDVFCAKKDETIFVIDCFGNILTHAHAVAALGEIIYPFSAILTRVIPLGMLEPLYSLVARNRHRLGISTKAVDSLMSCERTPSKEHSRIVL